MTTVLLGIPDQRIGDSKSSFTTNKIGGSPDWIKEDCQVPKCSECKRVMYLAMQLYCPLDGSSYHRNLYLFTCINKQCWNKSHSWKAIRSQQLDGSFSKKKEDIVSCAKETDNWGIGMDDWGTDADNWGTDADNWGTNADDWGTNADDLGNLAISSSTLSQTPSQCHDEHASQDDLDIDNPGFADDNHRLKNCKERAKPNSECSEVLPENLSSVASQDNADLDDVDMEKLNIHDIDDDGPDNVPSVVVEDDSVTMVTEDGVSQMMSVLACKYPTVDKLGASEASAVGVVETLVAYYMNVFEEPDKVLSDDRHIQKLLKDYQRTEVVDTNELFCQQMRSSGGGGGEKYEKDDIAHGDRYFHKFTKKIAVCPEQCVRYHWNGKALYISRPEHTASPRCIHCGETTVYEFQLMPALVNLLHFSNNTDTTTEFGTVIVYSCSVSCWQDGDSQREEVVYLQPEPDSHLFRK